MVREVRTSVLGANSGVPVSAIHLRVRLAAGEVAPLGLWLGDWAKWGKSAIWVQSASWNA